MMCFFFTVFKGLTTKVLSLLAWGIYTNVGLPLSVCAYNSSTSADSQSEAAITAVFGIMDRIIENLTVDSGLREGCESATDLKCNADQQSFKGITVEYMYMPFPPFSFPGRC